jgi:putative redox protein
MPTAEIIYLGDLRTSAKHIQSGIEIITDAPIDNNGKGEAFSPTDLVATGLGSCMMTVMGIFAKNHDIDLKGSTIAITKIMTAELPRRIDKIIVNLSMKSATELSDVDKKKLEKVAHTCPVALSLKEEITQEIVFNWV